MDTQARPITIGLLGHSVTSPNLGVGALTAAHMRILEEVGERVGRPVQFELAAWLDGPRHYIQADNLVVHKLSRSFIMAARGGLGAMVRRCDVVFDICAGDSFSDIYGTRRFMYEIAAQGVVLASRTPLVLAPQTIGPFQRRWVKEAARRIMRGSRAVFARDAMSTGIVSEMDPAIRLLEATDVAFHLPYETPARRDDGLVHVGVNVSGLLFNGGYRKSNDFGLKIDYAGMMRELMRRLTADDNVRVHLVGHVILPPEIDTVEDDQRVCEALAAEFPNVVAEPPSTNPSEVKSLIASMDFFCGARMHATIAAFSAGVPVVPVAYSRKFRGLYETIGYHRVADGREDDEEAILQKILDGFAQREQLKQEVDAAKVEAQRRVGLYREELVSLLEAQDQRRVAA